MNFERFWMVLDGSWGIQDADVHPIFAIYPHISATLICFISAPYPEVFGVFGGDLGWT